jgi:putative hydrolase of the HAD superfamily
MPSLFKRNPIRPLRCKGPVVWLFDLDNTLHNASAHIFPHLNEAMTRYLEQHLKLDRQQAHALREAYWRRYGATLQGLVRHHGVDPHHFLATTHQFEDLRSCVVFDRAVKALLRRLPGAKIVFSNGPRDYVNRVISLLGMAPFIDGVFAIEDMDFHPKPRLRAYRALLKTYRVPPHRCVMVEDSPQNLRPAKQLGMGTVLVGQRMRKHPHVDLHLAHILDLPRRLGILNLCPSHP